MGYMEPEAIATVRQMGHLQATVNKVLGELQVLHITLPTRINAGQSANPSNSDSARPSSSASIPQSSPGNALHLSNIARLNPFPKIDRSRDVKPAWKQMVDQWEHGGPGMAKPSQ
jgi:hypothetical protein